MLSRLQQETTCLDFSLVLQNRKERMKNSAIKFQAYVYVALRGNPLSLVEMLYYLSWNSYSFFVG